MRGQIQEKLGTRANHLPGAQSQRRLGEDRSVFRRPLQCLAQCSPGLGQT